ncbi:hypothetical protein GX50_00249 [[Emmonsia] crescens]|uniref:Uncharacterized protein n=1 Tax=[Emmonsia] crescens TaxID=73230 RepID=A0A2B7ZV02_9EURO|nr:hypothetical protein GX50_00249 [Emmonsia crescens]
MSLCTYDGIAGRDLNLDVKHRAYPNVFVLPQCQSPVFDINERIRERALDPNDLHDERKEFHVNIPTLIKLYKEGKMPDPNEKPTYLRDGKIMLREEYLANQIGAWEEVLTD